MKPSRSVLALALGLAAASAARAGAPVPDQRQGDFAHVCRGGTNKGLACTVATEAADCPDSDCVLQVLSQSIKGTLTVIAHDSVTDWAHGGAGNRALTVLLEVRGRDGRPQMLAATYQDLAQPTLPPTAPGNVVAIDMDEVALRNLATAVGGTLFIQPESTLGEQLQTIFGATGTPAIVAVSGRPESADHTTDGLATVLRYKVRIQFLAPV